MGIRDPDFGPGVLLGYSKTAVDEFVGRDQRTLDLDRHGSIAVTPGDITDASFPLVAPGLGYSRRDAD